MKRGILGLVVAAVVLVLASLSWADGNEKLRLDIKKLPKSGPGFPDEVKDTAEVLRRFYKQNGGRSLWVGSERMDDLVFRMQSAMYDGLNPQDYPIKKLIELQRVADKADDQGKAVIEIWFSTYFLKYASDMKLGRFKPRAVDPELHWRTKKIEPVQALVRLQRADSVDAFFEGWEPQIPAYRILKHALDLYLGIEENGGWPSVSGEETLRPGMESRQAIDVRLRLGALNKKLLKNIGGNPALYEGELVEAVKAFQKRHGLEPDGVVGAVTRTAMNVTVTQRIQQILVSMERWRWMPENIGKDFIAVNIAAYNLMQVQNMRVTAQMPVIVGQPYHRTPVFSDKIKYLEFNPYWNVPNSIAVNELLPRLKRNALRVAADGFEALQGDKVFDVTTIDWSQYSAKNFPYRLRQKPGGNNALGRVKFMFPNRFNVYLHDTPSHGLFRKASRALSHGCVRVSRPIELAVNLLANTPGWGRQRITEALLSGERTVVRLKKPMRIHIIYSTAWVGEGRQVYFGADIYGRDRKLYEILYPH